LSNPLELAPGMSGMIPIQECVPLPLNAVSTYPSTGKYKITKADFVEV